MKGVPGGWDVIDAGKKCGELGGKLYGGICLKSQKLDANADTIPFKCNPYQVLMPLLSFLLWSSSPTLCTRAWGAKVHSIYGCVLILLLCLRITAV